ncbi:hypothetical protein Y032_0409g935 [Ancylostoma ceylanicum]|uniref:Uncharacterized protein n=1 Tax=Ancylostoma ceylanicum TaxID=53326 RepID=A0A016X2F4_9BILA|nr:hypothetical protein Y032_0409g935 [Ancylostoma ceylanicum]
MLRSRSVDAQCSVRQGFLKKTVGSRKLALSPQHCPHPSKLHPPRNAKSTNHRQATYLLSRSRTHVQILQIRLKAAPTEILTFEVSRSPCARLPDNRNGNLNTEKKRLICGDTAVDTGPSVAILVSATPVNAIDLTCYEWSSLMYHVV